MATLYKFLSNASALKVLESGQIKLSTTPELNDLFDCSPNIVADDSFEELTLDVRTEFEQAVQTGFGMICLTKRCISPLLWGHYADSSRGFALGFESSELPPNPDARIEVKYQNSRPEVQIRSVEGGDRNEVLRYTLENFFGIKASEWAYEEEIRFLVDLNSPIVRTSQGMYFVDFPRKALRKVILGTNNAVDPYYLTRFLRQKFPGQSVEIMRAQAHPNKFEVEEVKLALNPHFDASGAPPIIK